MNVDTSTVLLLSTNLQSYTKLVNFQFANKQTDFDANCMAQVVHVHGRGVKRSTLGGHEVKGKGHTRPGGGIILDPSD